MAPVFKKRKLSADASNGYAIRRSAEETSGAPREMHEDRTAARGSNTATSGAREESTPFLNGAYNSNMFQLKVDELLLKVRPKYERRMVRAENTLRKLERIIDRIPSRRAMPIWQAEREQRESHKIRIPFPNPRPEIDAKCTLAYSKPASISTTGSYVRKTAIEVGDQMRIDLAVTMPSHLFQNKDYLNLRYFHKRAYYLACVATGIEEAEDFNCRLEFAFQNDNQLQPIIVVKPSQDDGEWDFSEAKCEIRVILAAGGETFPFSKTLPNKNCIRSKADANTVEKGLLMPTPFYNASLRSECSLLAYSDFLAGASSKSEGFRDACLLGSVWLRQRGLGTGSTSGGYGPFEWACTMALLMLKDVEGKSILSRGYSSYQLFKATLQFLSLEDLAASPYFIKHECLTLENHDQPVLFDGSRCMNLLFKMTPWSYASLRHEAGLALRLLSNPLPDRFDACFITKIDDPFQRFDCVINLPTSQFQSSASKQIDATDDQIVFCRQLYQALRIGLADRVKLIHLKPPQVTPWGPAPSNVSVEISSKIQIGLLLNPEQLNRIVDRGPSAEEKEAASTFRKFWGEKAELRRFKDGSILESLTWSVSGPKNSILMQIITHIIRRHIGDKEADGLEILGESFDDLIARKKLAASDALALYQPIMGAFTILEKQMRDLEGLPLQIRQISAADPQLRYASFKAPILDPIKSQREPANIHIQFEGSARWPDDLTAVQKTKIAFLLKIGELMAESTAGLTARLGLENTNRKILNGAFLDIFYPSGALFRLRIHHECEISMLERALKGKSPTSNPREETAFALSTYKRNFNQSALFTQAIQTLSTRFPLLSSSMRLMKKWRDCHLLSYHISDELVELLTIRTFVHPYPWSVPGSVMTGFLRTLRFISKWDWRYEPLIVDFNGEMSSAEIDAIHLRFEAWRKIDPAMNRVIMFAASSLDPVGVTWTEQGPSKVVAARFTSLAKLAIGTMRAQGTNVEPQTLFAASLADYDFVVHLTPKLAKDKQAQEKKESVFKNMQVQFNEDEGIAGFNPVRIFLSELRAMYGSSVLFFDNACQGPFIAGLWNPQTGPRPWKVNVKYSTIPTVHAGQDDAELSINKAATLHDIARLGGDMVSKVEAKR